MWSVTLALLSLRYLMHTVFTYLKKENNTNFRGTISSKSREMLQIRRDDDLPELQYHHHGSRLGPQSCISDHCLCHQSLWGRCMEQKPWKGTCFASSHRSTILSCFFKLLLLCFLQYSLSLWNGITAKGALSSHSFSWKQQVTLQKMVCRVF